MRVAGRNGVSRRDLMLAGGITSAVATIPAAAKAANVKNRAALLRAPTALMNEPPAAVTAALSNSKYALKKQSLISSGKYPFLAPFQTDMCVDAIIYDVTSNLVGTPNPYNPFQVESHAASLTQLLDRCLTNRREMYDIEEQAVRRALEYDLFQKQFAPQRDIELAPSLEAQRQTEMQGQSAAATEFSHSEDARLGAGFAKIAASTAASSQLAVNGEQLRKQNVIAKWTALADYQATLQDRHNTPGSALNYPERFGRLESILRQDIFVAYLKLKCIEAALPEIFGLSMPLQAPERFGYLDKMVMYLRQAIEQASIATQDEIDFDHVVSLHLAPATDNNGGKGNQIINDAQWNASLGPGGDGHITFTLANEFPAAFKTLRLKGLGLAVQFTDGSGDMINNTFHERSVAALVFPPQMPDLFAPHSFKNRAAIPIAAATWFDPNNAKLLAPSHVLNLDPRKGTWGIQISPNVIANSASTTPRSATVKEIKLIVRCGALIDDSVNPWPGFY